MLREYKLGQIIRWDNYIFKVVGFDNGIPLLNEIKEVVQFT